MKQNNKEIEKELLAILDMWENMEETQRLEQLKFMLNSKEEEMLDDEIKFLEELYEMGFNDGSRFQDMMEERLQKLKGEKLK